jgi:hypothetical protein
MRHSTYVSQAGGWGGGHWGGGESREGKGWGRRGWAGLGWGGLGWRGCAGLLHDKRHFLATYAEIVSSRRKNLAGRQSVAKGS